MGKVRKSSVSVFLWAHMAGALVACQNTHPDAVANGTAETVAEPSPLTPSLLTYEELDRITHSVPYILEVQAGKGELLYFGARHSYDPGHPQTRQIIDLWESFSPTIAFNEGGDPPTRGSVEEAVGKNGEPGLLRYLAARDEVPIYDIEPPREQLVKEAIDAGYPAEKVKLFYSLSPYRSYRRSDGFSEPEEFLDRVIRLQSHLPGLEGFPHNSVELAELYSELFPENPDWREVPDAFYDPVRTGNFMNELSRLGGWTRDLHMVDKLGRAVESGERVFAVVGASHVVMQEPVFRERFPRFRAWTLSAVAQNGGVPACVIRDE